MELNWNTYEAVKQMLRLRAYRNALEATENALAATPNDGVLLAMRAQALWGTGRKEESIQSAEAAVGAAPVQPYCWLVLTQVYTCAERWTEAREAAAKGLELRPEDARFLTEMGTTCYNTNQMKEALEWYYKALERDPEQTDAMGMIATIYFLQERYDKAKFFVQKGLELEPEDTQLLIALGATLMHEGKFNEAESVVAGALERDPHNDIAKHTMRQVIRASMPVYRIQQWITGSTYAGTLVMLYIFAALGGGTWLMFSPGVTPFGDFEFAAGYFLCSTLLPVFIMKGLGNAWVWWKNHLGKYLLTQNEKTGGALALIIFGAWALSLIWVFVAAAL